jgi:hypothetical protein
MENNPDSYHINFNDILIEENQLKIAESLTIENIQSNTVCEDIASDKTSIEVATPETINSFSILKYLSSIKEFELYYYLFNQISIISVDDNKIEIVRDRSEKNLNFKLAEILFTWTGNKWNVIIVNNSDKLSLKEQMKVKFMQSKEWKMLQEISCDITLTDIILE